MNWLTWLAVFTGALLQLGIIASGVWLSHKWADGIRLPKSTPWYVGALSILPVFGYWTMVLYAFGKGREAQLLSTLPVVLILTFVIVVLGIGIGYRQISAERFWLKLASKHAAANSLERDPSAGNISGEQHINDETNLRI